MLLAAYLFPALYVGVSARSRASAARSPVSATTRSPASRRASARRGRLVHAGLAAATPPLERGTRDELGDVEDAAEQIRARSAASIESYEAMRAGTAALLRDIAIGSQSVTRASGAVANTTGAAESAIAEIAESAGSLATGAERQVTAINDVRTWPPRS